MFIKTEQVLNLRPQAKYQMEKLIDKKISDVRICNDLDCREVMNLMAITIQILPRFGRFYIIFKVFMFFGKNLNTQKMCFRGA